MEFTPARCVKTPIEDYPILNRPEYDAWICDKLNATIKSATSEMSKLHTHNDAMALLKSRLEDLRTVKPFRADCKPLANPL